MAEYTNEFASATTETVTFTPPNDAPNQLWYWCHFHTGQGNTLALDNQSWIKLLDKNSPLGLLTRRSINTSNNRTSSEMGWKQLGCRLTMLVVVVLVSH